MLVLTVAGWRLVAFFSPSSWIFSLFKECCGIYDGDKIVILSDAACKMQIMHLDYFLCSVLACMFKFE